MDPIAHHFLLSLDAKYDSTRPVNPYSLFNLVFRLRPLPGTGYPLVVRELWVFAHLEADGFREFWVDVIRDADAGAEVWEPELVATYPALALQFGPEPAVRSGAWRVRGVPFPAPGPYTFRLYCEGRTLAEESVQFEE